MLVLGVAMREAPEVLVFVVGVILVFLGAGVIAYITRDRE